MKNKTITLKRKINLVTVDALNNNQIKNICIVLFLNRFIVLSSM